MSEVLTRHIGRCYETRVMGVGRYADALQSFRSEVSLSPTLRLAALAERARLEHFLAAIPGDQHRRCTASVENLKTLKDALDA